jgi:nucleoside phosphorylase
MKKKLTFIDYLEKERKREDILKSSSRLEEVLESARKINDISLSNSALKEIVERNNKLNSIIHDSSYANLREAINRIKVDRSAFDTIAKSINTSVLKSVYNSIDTSALKSLSKSYKSILNSVSPISKIYASELQNLRSSIENIGLKNIVSSESFIKAKELQNELIRFDPNIGILPITTLEKSIESEDPDPFDKATKEINSIEIVEQLKVSNSDTLLLESNPARDSSIDILIITGLPLELRIFCDVFNVDSRWFSDKFVTEYYFGSVISDTKKYTIALAFGEDMGNFYASQVTNAAIEDLNPKLVISAGIGYTLNPSKLQLCDLHITDSIVYWGLISKEYEHSGRKVRAIPVRVKSNHLFQETRKYVEGLRNGKTPFAQWVEDSRCAQPSVNESKVKEVLKEIDKAVNCEIPVNIFNERPKVEVGKTMVSDDAVIASIDEIKKRSLFDAGNENHISGDMEAAGVAMALDNRRSLIEFIAIRGISDFGFGKEALECSSNDFRRIAATRAATFIRSLFESDPTLTKTDTGAVRELGAQIK